MFNTVLYFLIKEKETMRITDTEDTEDTVSTKSTTDTNSTSSTTV